MTTLAKRFGLCDNGLRKHCKSMNIPTPPMGYWAKLQYGKPIEKIPLPSDPGKKLENDLREVDPNENEKIDITPQINPYKEKESEIANMGMEHFMVPEVLYAKDPLIIDTKEKLRRDTDGNPYLQKIPYKSKIGPTLRMEIRSADFMDRALCIYSTIINALRFRGHNVKAEQFETYAIVNGEKIKIDLVQRTNQGKEVLTFRIYHWSSPQIYRDTAHTRLEDKIISIIADLELHSEWLKERRKQDEIDRLKREEERRIQEEFEKRQKKEVSSFKSLFSMAERFHQTNILRHYLQTYEDVVCGNDLMTDEIKKHLAWAREKADWLDPFIDKDDEYLDDYDPNEILKPECPKNNAWGSSGYGYSNSSSGNNFWAKPWWKGN